MICLQWSVFQHILHMMNALNTSVIIAKEINLCCFISFPSFYATYFIQAFLIKIARHYNSHNHNTAKGSSLHETLHSEDITDF